MTQMCILIQIAVQAISFPSHNMRVILTMRSWAIMSPKNDFGLRPAIMELNWDNGGALDCSHLSNCIL